jgi:enoyl-CoA hydratase/carnithine racemase
VPAQEAHAWGLVNRLAPPGGTREAAHALAREIIQNAPLALGLAKYVVDHGDGLDRPTQMALERLAQSQLVTTEDFAEAAAAFLEKRPPDFKGA